MDENKTVNKEKKKFRFFDNIFVVLISSFLLLFLGQLLGYYITGDALNTLAESLFPGITETDVWITASQYYIFIGIWIVMLAVMAISPSSRPILKSLWTKMKGNSLKMLLLGLAMGLGMNLFCAFAAMLNGDISVYFDSFRPLSFVLIFICVFIQSSAEELICRAYLYQKVVKRYGKPLLAALVNALFFMVLHMGNPGVTNMALLNIFLYGLLFSAIVIYLDSLWAAMAAHAAWNFCQNILLGLPNSGIVLPYSVFKLDAAAAENSFAYSVSFGLEGTITACGILVVVAGLIVFYGVKKGIKPTDIWETNSAAQN